MSEQNQFELAKQIGKLEGRLDAIEPQVKDLKKDFDDRFTKLEDKIEKMGFENSRRYGEIQSGLGEIKAGLTQRDVQNAEAAGAVKGGWKVLTTVASIAVAAGGLISWILSKISFHP